VSFDAKPWIMQLKGKDYLVVAGRLVWLNQDHPRFTITTSFLKLEESYAIAYAVVEIRDEAGAVVKSATGTKREDKKDFADFESKAETGAIGRALGMLGIGTQYAVQDFDEMDTESGEPRIVESPVPHAARPAPAPKVAPKVENATDAIYESDYAHDGVTDDRLFSEKQLNRTRAIAGKLFNLKGEALDDRLLHAASKILKCNVRTLDLLDWKDGKEVMRSLEEEAVKRGVWTASEAK
jgi:hypothetical protein